MFLPFAPMIVGMHVLVATTGNVPRTVAGGTVRIGSICDVKLTCKIRELTGLLAAGARLEGDIGIGIFQPHLSHIPFHLETCDPLGIVWHVD